MTLPVAALRDQFPSLAGRPHGKRLAFLDSAASALKPTAVLQAMQEVLGGPYANIHRGLYTNSARTTAAFEQARVQVARFFGLLEGAEHNLIFTRNTTEAMNLLAHSALRPKLRMLAQKGQRGAVVLSALEHHANIVPWQLVAEEFEAEIRVIPLDESGKGLNLSTLPSLLEGATLLALTQHSNVLGVQPPLEEIVPQAKAAGALVAIDGSQAAVHGPVVLPELAALGVDFWACTGHKLYGPTGIGVLWGRPELLAAMPPYQGGGDMIDTVRLPVGTTFAPPPARFEAGTPAIAEAIGLGAACEWLSDWGWPAIQAHEAALAAQLSEMVYGTEFLEAYSPFGSTIMAFNVKGAHPSDVATLLDQHGVAVRSGHHCAMPLMELLGLKAGCVRASIGIYTTPDDLEQLAEGLHKAHRLLG